MTDIEELTQAETVKHYREFSTKSKIRLIIFVILWLISNKFYILVFIDLFYSFRLL